MNKLTAYCGLECAKCDGYKATQANDNKALESVAEKWRKQYNSDDITAEGVMCDGCTNDGRLSGYCRFVCKIRSCAKNKDIQNCAYCSDYDSCGELRAFLGNPGTAEAKATLEGIRSAK